MYRPNMGCRRLSTQQPQHSGIKIKQLQSAARINMFYHARTLLLFTINDFKTMIIPSAAFAIFCGVARLQPSQDSSHFDGSALLFLRMPLALIWAWVNLLAFAVNNQRQPDAIKEDQLNKPWRPIPSGRITPDQAKTLALFAYPFAILTSAILGNGIVASALLMIFGHLYNDMRLGDVSWLTRNMLNACGFTSFAAGTLEVATRSTVNLSTLIWLFMIGAVVCTTVHTQDMYDQTGDSAAGRRTIPIVFGDVPARWTIVLSVCFWSGLCPAYWRLPIGEWCVPVCLGLIVAFRSVKNRSVKADRTTFRIYNAWLVSLYALPLMWSYLGT